MAFSHKAWHDRPNRTTPLNAAALQDLEDRVAGYGDTQLGTHAADASAHATLFATELTARDTLDQLERAGTRQLVVANGSHRAEYEDATEFVDSLADLTAWTVGSLTVSGNKIIGSGSGVPVAKRPLALGTTGRGRFTALVSLPTSWTAKTFYIGVSTDNDVATALNPTLVGIGVRSTGNVSRFLGNSFTGGNSAGTNVTNTAVLSGVTGTQTLLATVIVDENSIGFSLRALTGTSAGLEWTYSVARSAAPGAITQVAVYNADSNGASGATVNNVGAKVSNGSFRTRTLEGQDVQVASVIAATSSDRWRIQLPIGYDSRKPAPVVIYCHQARTGWEQAPAFESRARPVAAALSAAGFILASAQDGAASTGSNSTVGSSGDRWGNQTSLDNQLALYKYLRDHYATSAVCLLGVSMGGLTVLNLAAQRKLPGVVAVAGIAGVYDLSLLYADATNFQADVKVAYGIASDGSDFASKTASYNPAVRSGSAYRGAAFRWYTSASDTVVTKASNADPLIASVTPYAQEANVVTASGAHLDASQFQGSDLVSFFQRATLQA